MSVHAVQSLVKIERSEEWLDLSEVVLVIHAVINLILEPIEVTESPFDFVSETGSFLIFLVLVHFLLNVHLLNI
jgi:hypothetical protein